MGLQDLCEAEDSDGEDLCLCQRCHLPVGRLSYSRNAERREVLHGECMAEHLLERMMQEEAQQELEDASKKRALREAYDLGWRHSVIPSAAAPATKLGCDFEPRGMCCLMYDEETHSVEVAPTLNPAEAVNLEYLSTALRVRRAEGTEPRFSLEPLSNVKSPSEAEGLLEKHFEPEWLAGTSVGEVLFQADYLLKELSMGEHEQPVVGMKSCLDFLEESGVSDCWNAREWFFVRAAEVQITEGHVLVPTVQMAVEAREQVWGSYGLEDTGLTTSSHPLVKYAEQFTRYFDLVAERRSVIFQLRELAKASLLAKLLLESDVLLPPSWFELAGERPQGPAEVPPVWTSRFRGAINLREGEVRELALTDSDERRYSLHGGVAFGLDELHAVLSLGMKPAGALVSQRVFPGATTARARPIMPRDRAAERGLIPISQETPLEGGAALASWITKQVRPTLSQPPHSGVPGLIFTSTRSVQSKSILSMSPETTMGVDLSLDKVDLAGPLVTVATAGPPASKEEKCAATGRAFWSTLKTGSGPAPASVPAMGDAHGRALLEAVLRSGMTDRQAEEDLFVPPASGEGYLAKLGLLVAEEQQVQQQRRQHFLSDCFVISDPGPTFPASWKPVCKIRRGKLQQPRLALLECQSDELVAMLKQLATPVFDKSTEDSFRYRIYKDELREVRTIQEPGKDEMVGAAFLIQAPQAAVAAAGCCASVVNDREKVVKASEYVERAIASDRGMCRRSYVVLETTRGHHVLTELSMQGCVLWLEDPEDLALRNDSAKLVRSADCRQTRVLVNGLRAEVEVHARGVPASESTRKRYVQDVYKRVSGCEEQSGFLAARAATPDSEAAR